jgi:hypothetical protein
VNDTIDLGSTAQAGRPGAMTVAEYEHQNLRT